MKAWLPNALAFQLVWIAAVGGAGRGWAWCGPLALLAFAAWRLPTSRWPRADGLLLGLTAVIGFGVDSLWVSSGLMAFAQPGPWQMLAPMWIVSLWAGFALTINHSMAALKAHLAWAALFGVLGGPLAYGVAQGTWGAVVLSAPTWRPLLALAIAWGGLTPALLMLATWLQRRTAPDVADAIARPLA